MKVYYPNESSKMLIIVNIAILIFVSPWLIAIYLGNHPPIWLMILLLALFGMDAYAIISGYLKKRLISRVKENIIFSDNEIIFDEPVDIEIGYSYVDMYTYIYKYKKRYYYAIDSPRWDINFKVIKKLKNVNRLQIPHREFYINMVRASMNISGTQKGTITYPLKFVKRKFMRYFYAPAIRVTSGKYKNLFIIIFDNNFRINVEGENDNFQIIENGIIFYNNTNNKCKLSVRLYNTYEGKSYIVKPGSTFTIKFFPEEPIIMITHYYRKNLSTIASIFRKIFPRNAFIGAGTYEIIVECKETQSKLKVNVEHTNDNQES